ncbi:hypothetical protein LSAT2_013415 [Lamellibrachia satsuma]|nr:hypothetical protein LSAT2_013415 [Lamellibrachia satsuma]
MFWVLLLSLLSTDPEATDAIMRFIQDDTNILLIWPYPSDCWTDCAPDETDDDILPGNVTQVCCVDDDTRCCVFEPWLRGKRLRELERTRQNKAYRARMLQRGTHFAFVLGLLQSVGAVLYYTGLYQRHCSKTTSLVVVRLLEYCTRARQLTGAIMKRWRRRSANIIKSGRKAFCIGTADFLNRYRKWRFGFVRIPRLESAAKKPRTENSDQKAHVETAAQKPSVESVAHTSADLGGADEPNMDDLILKLYFTQGDNIDIDEARRSKKGISHRSRRGH